MKMKVRSRVLWLTRPRRPTTANHGSVCIAEGEEEDEDGEEEDFDEEEDDEEDEEEVEGEEDDDAAIGEDEVKNILLLSNFWLKDWIVYDLTRVF